MRRPAARGRARGRTPARPRAPTTLTLRAPAPDDEARPLYWGLTPELKQYAVRAGRLTRVQADPAQKAALPLSSHQQRANQIELNAREIAGLSRALDAIAEKDVVASAERRRRRVRRRLLVSPS